MEIIVFSIIGCFILFALIAAAVKMAVKEVVHEFKEELFDELKLLSLEAAKARDKQQ